MANNILKKGWECPKCGAVMSPFTKACINCTGNWLIKPHSFISKSNFNQEEDNGDNDNGN